MELNSFKTDSSLENEGVWISCGPSSRVKIARIGSRRFRDAYKIKMRPFEAVSRVGAISEEDQEGVLAELVGESIILSWEGFTENGQPIPYSKENAIRVCKENRNFLLFIIQQSEEMTNFRPSKQDTEKNSGTVSAGS